MTPAPRQRGIRPPGRSDSSRPVPSGPEFHAPSPPIRIRAGYLPIIAAAVLWGSLGVAGRIAFRFGVTPLEAAFFRAAISSALLLPAMLIADSAALRVRPRDLGLFAAFGLISIAVFFFVYLFAIERASIATAAILLYTAPAFVVILSALVFGEDLSWAKVAAIVLAFAGCVLVVRGYDLRALRLSLPGILAGLASGFTYAMYSIFGKTALRRYSPFTTLAYALGFGAVFLGAVAIPAGVVRLSHPPQGWWAIVYLAVVTTLLAQALYLSGLRQVEAGRASLAATLEPVVAAVLGFVLLGEVLDTWQIVGGALVLTAVCAVGLIPRTGAGA